MEQIETADNKDIKAKTVQASVDEKQNVLSAGFPIQIAQVVTVSNNWNKQDNATSSVSHPLLNPEPRTLSSEDSSSVSTSVTSDVTMRPVESIVGGKEQQQATLKQVLDIVNKPDNTVPGLVKSSEESAFKANCVSVPVSTKRLVETPKSHTGGVSFVRNLEHKDSTGTQSRWGSVTSTCSKSEIAMKGPNLVVPKSSKGASPKRDYATGFIHKSKRTPVMVNTQHHSIASSHFHLNLTESVQKLLKPLPVETTPISVSIDLTKSSDSLNSTVTQVSSLNSLDTNIPSAINSSSESSTKLRSSISEIGKQVQPVIEESNVELAKSCETNVAESSKVLEPQEIINCTGKVNDFSSCDLNNTETLKTVESEIELPVSEVTLNCDSIETVKVNDKETEVNIDKSDPGIETCDTNESNSLTASTASALDAVNVSVNDSNTANVPNSALSPELTESLKRHSYSSPIKHNIARQAMVVKSDDTPSSIDESKDTLGANLPLFVEGSSNNNVVTIEVQLKEQFKETEKPESSQTEIVEVLGTEISLENNAVDCEISSTNISQNPDENMLKVEQQHGTEKSNCEIEASSKKLPKNVRPSRARHPPVICENDSMTERRSTRGSKRKLVCDHQVQVLDIKKPCNPGDLKTIPEISKENDTDAGNIVEPIHIKTKGKRHMITKGPDNQVEGSAIVQPPPKLKAPLEPDVKGEFLFSVFKRTL